MIYINTTVQEFRRVQGDIRCTLSTFNTRLPRYVALESYRRHLRGTNSDITAVSCDYCEREAWPGPMPFGVR